MIHKLHMRAHFTNLALGNRGGSDNILGAKSLCKNISMAVAKNSLAAPYQMIYKLHLSYPTAHALV